MSEKNKNVPKIRFPGFVDDWEQGRLGELGRVVDTKHATAPIIESKSEFKMIRTSTVREGRLYPEKMDSTTAEIYEIWSERIRLKENDVVFSREAPIGEAAVIPKDDNRYFLGQRMVGIRTNNDLDPGFLLYTFLAPKFKREIAIRNAESTTVANFGIYSLKNYEFDLPKIKEQNKIAEFFKKLDNLITLYQRKLNHLQNQKKSLLQNIFPKNGADVPEIRFPGFTDAWEQRKLGEVADIYDGTHQTPKYTESGVRFVSVENIATLETTKFISQEAYDKEYSNKQAEKGDVLMTRIGDVGTAKVIETEEPLAYYVTLALLKPKQANSDFLTWLISSPEVQRNIWRRTLHIAFPKKINLGEINQVELKLPDVDEQAEIGAFFKEIDNLITLHQRKLNHLQEQKKALLQQMFI